MSYFEGFTKKAVVVVPPHHVLRQRTSKRNTEMGQPVPEDAINAMKGERDRVSEWTRGGGGGGREERERGERDSETSDNNI